MADVRDPKGADTPMSRSHFLLMSLVFKVRDLLTKPGRLLEEAKLGAGARVLDYGCGPGSYSIAAAELVGEEGRVVALDIYSGAIAAVERRAAARGLSNLETVLAGDPAGLEAESFDVALLYDAFHGFADPRGVLEGIHRALKPQGLLSFSDHHLADAEIVERVTRDGLFSLIEKGRHTHLFARSAPV